MDNRFGDCPHELKKVRRHLERRSVSREAFERALARWRFAEGGQPGSGIYDVDTASKSI